MTNHDAGRNFRPKAGSEPGRLAIPLGRKIVYSAVAFIAVLGILEGGARLLFRAVSADPLASQRRLVDAVGFPTLNQLLVPDPNLFWTVRPDVERWMLSGRVQGSGELSFTVSTDRNGCRRLPIVTSPRRRIAFLGDSTTFGVGVHDDATFSAVLQARLAGMQCVNLGVPGFTAYQGRRRLERFPFDAPPDVVVVTFGFNDDAPWDGLSDLEHARVAARGEWVKRSSLLSALALMLQRQDASGGAVKSGERRPRLSDSEYSSELQAIGSWCRNKGAVPVYLLWPRRDQQPGSSTAKQLALLGMTGTAGHVIDLRPVLRDQGGESVYVDVIHASRAGNAAVAAALEPVLRNLLQ